jgi:hypothetical protein
MNNVQCSCEMHNKKVFVHAFLSFASAAVVWLINAVFTLLLFPKITTLQRKLCKTGVWGKWTLCIYVQYRSKITHSFPRAPADSSCKLPRNLTNQTTEVNHMIPQIRNYKMDPKVSKLAQYHGWSIVL